MLFLNLCLLSFFVKFPTYSQVMFLPGVYSLVYNKSNSEGFVAYMYKLKETLKRIVSHWTSQVTVLM